LRDLKKIKGAEERRMAFSQINYLKGSFKKTEGDISEMLEKFSIHKPLPPKKTDLKIQYEPQKEAKTGKKFSKKIPTSEFERKTLKRLKKREKKDIEKKIKKPSKYVNVSNNLFSDFSIKILDRGIFRTLKRDLVRANLQFLPKSYISVILFTTLLSAIAAVFIFLFFLFFRISSELPIIVSVDEGIFSRFLKVFWILFAVPAGTFLLMYFYPSMERKVSENRINQELPFVTIHMAAIAGSMIEPSKIFSIYNLLGRAYN